MAPLFEMATRVARVDQHRTVVFAYDVGCSKRSYRIRRTLQGMQTAAQYSVIETWLTPGQRRDVLAELTGYMEMSEDRLAVWSPCRQTRVVVRKAGAQSIVVSVVSLGGAAKYSELALDERWGGCGNCIVCYDIRDAARLRAIASTIAPETVALQRSVYWLRAGWTKTHALLHELGAMLDPEDSLWAYPVAHAGDIWRIQAAASAMLPIKTDARFNKRQGGR